MDKFNSIFLLLVLTTFFQPPKTRAQYIIHERNEEGPEKSQTIALPYAFSSKTLGLGIGLGTTFGPRSQPQSTYYGTAYVTDNGSWIGLIGGHNLIFRNLQRLSFRPYMSFSQDTQLRIYGGYNNPAEPAERAGSNDSDPDNYLEADAKQAILNLEIRYTLPWGHFRESSIHTYVTRNGILQEHPSGATSINPLTSGQSIILLKPYYRKIFTDVEKLETLYFKLGFEHDNRDFVPNPHRGYKLKFAVSHDPDWLQETRKWTSLEGGIDSFIPLWEASWSRQQTLALSWWTAYSPSFDESSLSPSGKPPYFTGPTLGGLWRLRGYPSNRFHDKSAIYYGAEYRIMPE